MRGGKRLVVSGLEEGNLDAELAVKRWCEVRSNNDVPCTGRILTLHAYLVIR